MGHSLWDSCVLGPLGPHLYCHSLSKWAERNSAEEMCHSLSSHRDCVTGHPEPQGPGSVWSPCSTLGLAEVATQMPSRPGAGFVDE